MLKIKECYIPVDENLSYEDSITVVKNLIAPYEIDKKGEHFKFSVLRVIIKNESEPTLLIIRGNTKFASDPRNFILVRLHAGDDALAEQLVKRTLEAGGYVGNYVSEGVNSKGKRVFNVADGSDHVVVGYGEVWHRLLDVGVKFDKGLFAEDSVDALRELFKSSVGFDLERLDVEGARRYKIFIKPQKLSEYQSIPQK